MNEVSVFWINFSLWILLQCLVFFFLKFYYPPILRLRELIGKYDSHIRTNVFLGENEEGTEINLTQLRKHKLRSEAGARLRGAIAFPLFSQLLASYQSGMIRKGCNPDWLVKLRL